MRNRRLLNPLLWIVGIAGVASGIYLLTVSTSCESWFILLTGIVCLSLVILSRFSMQKTQCQQPARFTASTCKEIPSKIFGVTYDDPITGRPRQTIIRHNVRKGTILTPRTEPGNEYDENAVALWIDDRFHIGYIRSGDLSKEVAEAIRYNKQVGVKVLNVTGGTAKKPTTGVNILIRIEI